MRGKPRPFLCFAGWGRVHFSSFPGEGRGPIPRRLESNHHVLPFEESRLVINSMPDIKPTRRARARKHDAKPQVHHAPQGFSDRFALAFTRLLRFGADTFFAKRYGHRAIVLETVAAVPGMVRADEAHHRDVNHGFASKLAGEPVDHLHAAPYPPHADKIRMEG